jgi:hypothetical protein
MSVNELNFVFKKYIWMHVIPEQATLRKKEKKKERKKKIEPNLSTNAEVTSF